MKRLVAEAGREDEIAVESAGTGDWHVGHPPDERATEAAARRGVTLSGSARQVTRADFEDYDLIVAMDRANQRDLRALGASGVVLLRSYDAEAVAAGDLDVPDPYYGGEDGFEHVLDVVERGARGLLATL